MRRGVARAAGIKIFLLVMAVCVGAIPGLAQETPHLVFRIDPQNSEIEGCNWAWGGGCEILGYDFGRFKMFFDENGPTEFLVWFEDIDTASIFAGSSDPWFGDFLPEQTAAMGATPWLSDDWIVTGSLPWRCSGTYRWGVLNGDMRQLTLDLHDPQSCPCCPDFGSLVHKIVAHSEPILIDPAAPLVNSPSRALVNWVSPQSGVTGVTSSVAIDGNLILIYGDVEVDPSPSSLPGFYSFTTDLPPLPPGSYRAQYWARELLSGEPLEDYVLQGGVEFSVQAPIPAGGPLSWVILVLALAGAAVFLLRQHP